MKKKILLPFLFLIAFAAHAQVKKHAFLPGLDLNYSTSQQDYYSVTGAKVPGSVTATNFSIAPNLGFFVSDRVAVGISAAVSINNQKDEIHGYVNLSPKTINKSITAYARHYTFLGEKIQLFFQGDLTWGRGSYSSAAVSQQGDPVPYTEVTHFFKGGIRPGIVYFLTPRLGLETTFGFLGYTKTYAGNDDLNFQEKNVTSGFGISLSPSTINFGFRFYLANRKTEGGEQR